MSLKNNARKNYTPFVDLSTYTLDLESSDRRSTRQDAILSEGF